MSSFTSSFPPSKNLENYLKSFIHSKIDLDGPNGYIDTIIRYSFVALTKVCKIGPRGRTLSKSEFEHVLVTQIIN